MGHSPGPRDPASPKYRGLGRLLLVLSVPLLVVGVLFQLYPTVTGCTGFDFFGYCSQMGPVHPYALGGDGLLAFFVLLVVLGLLFSYWTPTPPIDVPVVHYVPFAMPPPPPPPVPVGVPPSSTIVVAVHQAPAAAPKIMTRCRNCGSMFDMLLGRCDRCGAPAS